MKQVPSSRFQRNKGLRVKNVLQICLLVALCFWLLYQMKHSYGKKKSSEDHNSRILNDVADSQPDFIDLGRKDHPRDKETLSGDKTSNKEEDNEVEEEEDQEDGETKGIGNDVIKEEDHEQGDEQDDQERGDEEAEDGEEAVSEEDKDDQVEEAEFLEDHEHEDGSSQEAHEKIYKRDDASSAVLQENQLTGTEDKNDSVEEEQLQNNEKDMETNDTIGRKDDDPKDNNDANVTVVVVTGNETIQNSSLTMNGAAVEKTGRELSR